MSFSENKFEVLYDAISDELSASIIIQMELLRKVAYYKSDASESNFYFGDKLVKNSFSWYSAFFTEALSIMFLPTIEKIVGKKLIPTYSYCRIYYPGSVMRMHRDRPSCEYSATLTIGVDGIPWNIFFKEEKSNRDLEIYMPPKTMIVYKGCELYHWRNECTKETKKQYQCFLHYIDADGPYKEYALDTRPILGLDGTHRRKDLAEEF